MIAKGNNCKKPTSTPSSPIPYKHSLVENSTIYRNRSSDWSIWLVICRLYGRVAAEAESDNVNASAVVRMRVG